MSKPSSGLFDGTKGAIAHRGDAESTIASRVSGLDLREHPVKMRQLNTITRRSLAQKVRNRTATREEYTRYMWDKRFRARRAMGVKEFWKQERKRLKRGEEGTRNWSPEQRDAILAGKRPKFGGKSIQAHHSYSATFYPQLANMGEIIYPTTHTEHHKGWHGGNYKKSLPGKRIRPIKEF